MTAQPEQTQPCCRAYDARVDSPAHFHVYVVELAGKDGAPTTPPTLYVGQTVHAPDHRFAQHRAGIRAARAVRRGGLWLRRRLYAHWNPLTSRADSEHAERRLAAHLRAIGYVVKGGH
jgi:hypothetical protein